MDDREQPVDRETGLIRLNKRRCSTCIYWMDERSPVSNERAEEVIQTNVERDALLTCHQTLSYGDYPDAQPAVCNGYWADKGRDVLAGRVAQRLIGILRVDPPEG